MIILNDKDLKNLPVEDQNGKHIGRVVGFEIEADSQTIVNYIVSPKQVMQGIFEGKLIINNVQVVELTKEKLVIDNLEKTKQTTKQSVVV
jgi:sporulation protein YlmC with PRC-barrel domain